MSATSLHSSWPGLTRPSSALASASANDVLGRVDTRLLDGRLKGGHDEIRYGVPTARECHASRATLPLLELAAATPYQDVASDRRSVRQYLSHPPPRGGTAPNEKQCYCRRIHNPLKSQGEAQ